jgi:hypothetical protein
MFRNQTSPKLPWKDFFLHLQLCFIVQILSKRKYYVTNCYICICFKYMYFCGKNLPSFMDAPLGIENFGNETYALH